MTAIQPLSAGEFVATRVRAAAAVRIAARFEHSLYLRLAPGWFACLGTESIGRGPLNILLSNGDWRRLARTATEGADVAIGHGSLRFGHCEIACGGAPLWRPRQLDPRRVAAALVDRFDSLGALGAACAPAEGLGALAFGGHSQLLGTAAAGWSALAHWLAGALAQDEPPGEPPAALAGLIGLGPGLTPSGDDLLCGALVSMHALDRAQSAASLWAWLSPQLATGTSDLSAAHLAAAAAGQGHEALHAVLAALADGAALEAVLPALARVGHCSGWDALAGVVAVGQALRAADQRTSRRAASSAACALDGATITPQRSSVRT